MKQVTLYCDGSSLGNPGHGGWCAILIYKDKQKILRGSHPLTTNNRMELTAMIQGIQALKISSEINVYSDSQYVVNGINAWLDNWIAKDFNGVKNVDLWREFVDIRSKHKIHAFWVKGHNGDALNEMCDKIAREEAGNSQLGLKATNME